MPVIYTIGYGGRTIEEFIGLLKKYEIDSLVDVRSVPYSRFYADFRKERLHDHLQSAHITYRFMGETLGGRPKDEACFVDGKLNAERCEEREWYQAGITALRALAQNQCVAILCSEKDPLDCHRSYVVGATLNKEEKSEVLHIGKAGQLKAHRELNLAAKPKEKRLPF